MAMLKLSTNGKTKFSKSHKNTFGLLHGLPRNGGTCVGATCGKGGCLDTRDGLKRKTCYVEKITQIYKAVGATLTHNTELLRDKTQEEMENVLREAIAEFAKRNGEDGLFFRLHWAGDFFSLEYAKAWAKVMEEFPNIRFWVYTRSFKDGANYIAPLLGTPNLSLYLSCDPENIDKAKSLYDSLTDQYHNLGLAWLGDNAPEQDKYRWVVCPETSRKVKNTKECGSCSKCRLCVDNYVNKIKNIKFLIH